MQSTISSDQNGRLFPALTVHIFMLIDYYPHLNVTLQPIVGAGSHLLICSTILKLKSKV